MYQVMPVLLNRRNNKVKNLLKKLEAKSTLELFLLESLWWYDLNDEMLSEKKFTIVKC